MTAAELKERERLLDALGMWRSMCAALMRRLAPAGDTLTITDHEIDMIGEQLERDDQMFVSLLHTDHTVLRFMSKREADHMNLMAGAAKGNA